MLEKSSEQNAITKALKNTFGRMSDNNQPPLLEEETRILYKSIGSAATRKPTDVGVGIKPKTDEELESNYLLYRLGTTKHQHDPDELFTQIYDELSADTKNKLTIVKNETWGHNGIHENQRPYVAPKLYITLPTTLGASVTLATCIQNGMKDETNPDRRCGTEGCKVTGLLGKTNFASLPAMFIAQLGRYTDDATAPKIGTLVNFENILPLTEENGPRKTQKNYKLHAIIRHHGTRLNSGHYTAVIKISDGWLECNDLSVHKTELRASENDPNVLKGTADDYMCIYVLEE
ncbi:hypothetical protein FACS189472_01450 [Alphaproteobacteria bacterium]|nr:hypothetical protein FACS189472_01450 [Alphaproteobacteria bacterium]